MPECHSSLPSPDYQHNPDLTAVLLLHLLRPRVFLVWFAAGWPSLHLQVVLLLLLMMMVFVMMMATVAPQTL
jgi:hypothetical protein